MKKIVLPMLLSGIALMAAEAPYISGVLLSPQPDKIYAKECASCHGDDGKQTSVKGFPEGIKFEVIAGKDAAWLAKTLKEYRGGIKEKDYQPLNRYGYGAAMKGPTVDLSWKEIDALAEYVSKMK
jgi:cytochrome c553